MNGNAELLNFVYQNSEMGVNTIKQLIDIVEDDTFKEHLEAQYREYKELNNSSRVMLNDNGYDEKGIGTLDKIKTYLMINLQTLTDKTSSHVSEMLIIGSNMGILNAVKNLKKYQEADKDILSLMKRLLNFEENNVQRLKNFL